MFDVPLPGPNALDLPQESVKADIQMPGIFSTGHGEVPTFVRAMKAGAVEFSPAACSGAPAKVPEHLGSCRSKQR